jgi:hypothetical protein
MHVLLLWVNCIPTWITYAGHASAWHAQVAVTTVHLVLAAWCMTVRNSSAWSSVKTVSTTVQESVSLALPTASSAVEPAYAPFVKNLTFCTKSTQRTLNVSHNVQQPQSWQSQLPWHPLTYFSALHAKSAAPNASFHPLFVHNASQVFSFTTTYASAHALSAITYRAFARNASTSANNVTSAIQETVHNAVRGFTCIINFAMRIAPKARTLRHQ